MRVVVAGATGFIGKAVSIELFKRGYDVSVLSRTPKKVEKKLGIALEASPWAPALELPSVSALQGVDAILYFAGESVAEGRWTLAKKERIFTSRVTGLKHLIERVSEMPESDRPKTIISASAIGIYGNRGDEELTEDSETGDDFLAEVCSEWERILLDTGDIKDVRRVALRFGLVMGPAGDFLSRLVPIFEAGLGGKIGSGKQWMSWISIDDLVRMVVSSLEDAKWRGVYNCVSPQPITNAEFTKDFSDVLKVPAIFNVPSFVLRMVLSEFGDAVLASQRVLPRRALAEKFEFKHRNLKDYLTSVYRSEAGDKVTSQHFESYHWVDRKPEEICQELSEAAGWKRWFPERFKIDLKFEKETVHLKILNNFFHRNWIFSKEETDRGLKFTQKKGPLSFFSYEIDLEESRGGTLIRDKITYQLLPWRKLLRQKLKRTMYVTIRKRQEEWTNGGPSKPAAANGRRFSLQKSSTGR